MATACTALSAQAALKLELAFVFFVPRGDIPGLFEHLVSALSDRFRHRAPIGTNARNGYPLRVVSLPDGKKFGKVANALPPLKGAE